MLVLAVSPDGDTLSALADHASVAPVRCALLSSDAPERRQALGSVRTQLRDSGLRPACAVANRAWTNTTYLGPGAMPGRDVAPSRYVLAWPGCIYHRPVKSLSCKIWSMRHVVSGVACGADSYCLGIPAPLCQAALKGRSRPPARKLWRDEHLVAIFKPAGWLVHRTVWMRGNTFVVQTLGVSSSATCVPGAPAR